MNTDATARTPKGRSFIVDECKFDPKGDTDWGVLGIDEGKILDWPMVYILHNEREAYVGQTTSVQRRMLQHAGNEAKRTFKNVSIIFNELSLIHI